jgi:cytochrome c-type biogenesis protein CcmH
MTLRISKLILLFFVITAFFMLAGPVLAQQPDFDRINEIAKKLNCPTCTGINLADCRTLTCQQWRDQIGELVKQGYSDQEVLDYFSTRFGPQVLQEPPRSGSTLILWVLPVVAIIIGLGLLVYVVRSWTGSRKQAAATENEGALPGLSGVDAVVASDDYLAQVEKDLERGD